MIVIDASVWVSWIVQKDVNHRASVEWFNRYHSTQSLLIAPYILLAEVAGPIARLTGDSAFARQVITDLLQLSRLRLVPIDDNLGIQAAHVAADINLRGADAIYVAVAQHLNIPLITWDKEQLQRGAQRVSVATP